jgi:hypothetical protein
MSTTVESPENCTAVKEIGIPTTQEKLEAKYGYKERDVDLLLRRIDCRRHYRQMKRVAKMFKVKKKDRLARFYEQARIASRTILQEIGADYGITVPGLVPGMSFLSDAKNPRCIPVVLDTGASISITPFESDFVGELSEPPVQNIVGVADHRSKVLGIGTVRWEIRDALHRVKTIETQAYLVPVSYTHLTLPTKA